MYALPVIKYSTTVVSWPKKDIECQCETQKLLMMNYTLVTVKATVLNEIESIQEYIK